jgi:GcrA cell cycle regulator
MTDVKWTDNDVIQISALWKNGKSAREIGSIMNRSRNSIIGKVHRLGFSKLDQNKSFVYKIKSKPTGLPRALRKLPKNLNYKAHKIGVAHKYKEQFTTSEHISHIYIADDLNVKGYKIVDPQFNSKNCKWWVNGEWADTQFCCQPVWGKASYCQGHQYRSLNEKQPEPRNDAKLFKYLIRRTG